MIEDEIRRATKLLATLVQIAGLNRQDLDRLLGQGRGYSSQVLTGRVELKYRHVLAILEVVDVERGFSSASSIRSRTSRGRERGGG